MVRAYSALVETRLVSYYNTSQLTSGFFNIYVFNTQVASLSIFIIQFQVVCLTFEVLFTKIPDYSLNI